MALLSVQDVSIGYGGPMLLEKINLQIEKGERIGLLGRNGEGKTTLIRLINGDIIPDEGVISIPKGVSKAILPQEVPSGLDGTVSDVVAGGMKFIGDGWSIDQHVETVISRLKLNPLLIFENLSAGLKRRALLARALVRNPDILMLDEPTNHLDLESIKWLEDFLLRYKGTLIFVTHDRAFLQKLANRIVEIDCGNLTTWSCDYSTFLNRKNASLESEAEEKAQFSKKLAKEEEWIRKGIKARRTRNEGRVRVLIRMREERSAWRERAGSVRMQVQDAERTGKLVVEAKNITYGYDGEVYIKNFSTTIIRGDRVGVIGPNGCGKSTLLGLLLGKIPLQEGTVKTGTKLNIAYFDQLREQLDEEKTVCDNISEGKDILTINGKPKHVIGYLKDFLFSPDRARSPLKTLSGGERNRLLLARLFSNPSNVLVLDEPTNDLDLETLELLEELLLEYSGTILLVSHDREFLNNVVTSILAFEGEGHIAEYAGGYDDWLSQRNPVLSGKLSEERRARSGKKAITVKKNAAKDTRPRKIGFKEQRELDALPKHIEDMEQEQHTLYNLMADPKFYQKDGDEIRKTKERLETLEKDLKKSYKRWEELEEINTLSPAENWNAGGPKP